MVLAAEMGLAELLLTVCLAAVDYLMPRSGSAIGVDGYCSAKHMRMAFHACAYAPVGLV
jgi:hypothetical protein